jgi:hypothetical protein
VHQLRVYLDINTTTSREAGSFHGQYRQILNRPSDLPNFLLSN